MDRGIPGEPLPASDRDVEKNPLPPWRFALDSDGLSFSAPAAAKHSRLLESKGLDLEPRREEKSILCHAAMVS